MHWRQGWLEQHESRRRICRIVGASAATTDATFSLDRTTTVRTSPHWKNCRPNFRSGFGYCLVTNHVHLVVDPGAEFGNLGLLMKRLAGRHRRPHEHYRAFVAEVENEFELKFIRESLQRGHVTGFDDYAQSLARRTGVTLPNRSPGRTPKKKTGAEAPDIVVI